MTSSTPDARALGEALAGEGMACRVEARERLAVLVPERGDADAWRSLADAARRRALHQLATRHGFTHVALELDPDDAGGDDGA